MGGWVGGLGGWVGGGFLLYLLCVVHLSVLDLLLVFLGTVWEEWVGGWVESLQIEKREKGIETSHKEQTGVCSSLHIDS